MHFFYLKCSSCGETVKFEHPDNFVVRLTVIDCLTCSQRRHSGDVSMLKKTIIGKKSEYLYKQLIKEEGNAKDNPLFQQMKKERLI